MNSVEELFEACRLLWCTLFFCVSATTVSLSLVVVVPDEPACSEIGSFLTLALK